MAGTPIISYAQHDEDVRLARCFQDIAQGFYIDVGAWHPMVDSVTCHFYKRGWTGINVEPMPTAFALLERYRMRDINLACLVGDGPGTQVLHATAGSGLSTTSDAYAARAAAAGLAITPLSVPRRTLAEICTSHAPETVHFLKVDVEGDEPVVLAGHDWTRWRPWVVVVEGTEPNAPTRSDAACRPILARAGYRHATFDGLNDFYVAEEHAPLAARLAGPVTPFERAGRMREHSLSDILRGGPLGRWHRVYRQAAAAELLARGRDFDVAAYLRALALPTDAHIGTSEIARIYTLVLGRSADASSLSIWSALAASDGLTVGGFLARLCDSDEYMTLRLAAEAYLDGAE